MNRRRRMWTRASPEAWPGGPIGLIEDRDEIEIDVDHRMLRVNVGDDILAERRPEMEAFERAVGTAEPPGWCRTPCRPTPTWRPRWPVEQFGGSRTGAATARP